MNSFVPFQGIRPYPNYIDVSVLGAGTGIIHAIPSSGAFVFFAADGDFWARPDAIAVVPTGNITNGGGSEFNPTSWALSNLTGIGLISASARKITLSFYSL